MLSTLTKKIKDKKYKQFKIFFGLSLFSFSLWLAAFWPGVMTFDSLASWKQIQMNRFDDWHPYVYTYFIKIVTFFYFSPAVFAILQILISSILGSYVFYKLYQKIEKKWIVWLAFFGYVSSVTIGLYNITVWKDVLFSQLIVFWGVLLYFRVSEKREIENRVFLASLGILLFFTATIRHNGVIFLFFVPLFFYLAKVVKIKSAVILAVLAISFYLIFLTIVPKYLHVEMQQPLTEISQIQLMAAVLSSNHVIYDESKNPPLSLLDKVLPREQLEKTYICQSVDPVLDQINTSVLDNKVYKDDFNRIFFPLMVHNFPQAVGDRACILTSVFLGSGSQYGNLLESDSLAPDRFPHNLGLKLSTPYPGFHSVLLQIISITSQFPLNLIFRALFFPLLLFVCGLTLYRRNKPLFFYSLMVSIQIPFLIPLLPASDFRYFYFLHFGFFFLIPMFFIKTAPRKVKR